MKETIVPKLLFNKQEITYRKLAVLRLADWYCGLIENPLMLNGRIIFTPDVTYYHDGIISCIYEVVHEKPLNGKQLGMIQYYCFRMGIEITVLEVSASYILSLQEKPFYIKAMECHIINPFM